MNDEEALQALSVEIRRARVSLGISQESFADSIGMHRAQYSKIERGERNVTVLTLRRIAAGLDTKLGRLLGNAGL